MNPIARFLNRIRSRLFPNEIGLLKIANDSQKELLEGLRNDNFVLKAENDGLKEENSEIATQLEKTKVDAYLDNLTGVYNANCFHKMYRKIICAIENDVRAR